MRFDRIRLSNFKCYADADLSLDGGVTVIHGLNGSGKSSLLEAAFFALYGARALDRTLDEVITIGADEAEIELWFTHDAGSYHLRRRLRRSGDRVQTAECVLETPAGSVDGAIDVESHVASLLRMDDEAFVNCAYVRQGEVNKLINATPSERQDMIDDLLQLGTLEDYRARASDARLAVREVQTNVEAQLETLDEQIRTREDENPHERLNALLTERNELEAEIERFEENREDARETLADAEAVIEEYEEKREELADVEETIADLREKIAATERERESLQETAADHRDRATALDDRVTELLAETDLDAADPDAVADRRATLDERRDAIQDDISEVVSAMSTRKQEAEDLAERADELEARAAEKREQAGRREAEAEEAKATLADGEEKIERLETEINERRETFEDAPVEFGESDAHRESLVEDLEALRETERELRDDLATAHSHVEEAEALLAEGKCPECGQPVEGSPHVDTIDEDRERVEALEADLADLDSRKEALEERIERAEALRSVEREVDELESRAESAANLLAERERSVDEKRERADELRSEADKLEARAEETRERAESTREEARAKQEELGELNQQQAELREQVGVLDDLAAAVDERADHWDALERIREKRADLADRNDERREHLASARERRDALADAYDEQRVEAAREDKTRAEDYLSDVAAKLSDLRERRTGLDNDIGAVENTIESLEDLRDGRNRVAERVDALRSLHEETEDLEAMYGDLRAELRRRNVDTLEAMLNEVFDLVYQNDSYSRIELSGDYELTVFQKNGEPLDPDQLSGGERALFNLSLRTAIYRLLAEGIDGSAPMPPLILDEPTVFLDSGHVSRLVDLVESMRSLGVEQIIVVSHDDVLVDAADDVVRVRKDPTTNRSHVERPAEAVAD